MPVPHESGPNDQQLARYLLGLLPEEDAERLDEMSIADDEVASRLRIIENDLVDTYVRGTMPDDTRARFESVYLSRPRGRAKVKFAESFLGVADRAAVPGDADTADASPRAQAVEPPDASPRSSPPGRVSSYSMPWRGLALAAALVLAAGGGLLVSEMRVRNGLHEARTGSAVLERRAHDLELQLRDQHAANAETVKELERVRASLAELTQRSSSSAGPLGQAASASQAPTMVALILSPQTRGAGPIPTVAVPQGAGDVAFELQLDANDFSRYDVALKDPATGHVAWRSSRIAARAAGDVPVVSISVPARALSSQRYAFELTGYAAAGGAQVVSSYAFRIVRR